MILDMANPSTSGARQSHFDTANGFGRGESTSGARQSQTLVATTSANFTALSVALDIIFSFHVKFLFALGGI